MEFNEKLRALRKEKGISQQALADAIYISRSAVAKWENGLGLPSPASMQALAAYFGVSESYFTTQEPELVIQQKDATIRDLLFCFAAMALIILVTSSALFIPYLFQHPLGIGFTSQAAAGVISDAPCVQTDDYDFYLAGSQIKGEDGAVLGYCVSRVTAVRKLGLLHYRQTLQWHSQNVSCNGKLVGTLLTYQNEEGCHNVLLTNSSFLLLPLLDFDTVTADRKDYPAQHSAYFLTDTPITELEIAGFQLVLSEATEMEQM